MDENVLPKLFSLLSSAVDAVKGHDNVHIFSHHDADGISAAIILAKTMMRAGKGFKVTLFGTLNDETMDIIRKCGAKCIIIADMGVSYIPELDVLDADVIVLDHHKGDPRPLNVRYANPHSFGVDGMQGACGASMAMLFSAQYDKNNWDLVQVAFAGIIGDKQHQRGLTDINEYLFAEGSRRGYISKVDGGLVPPGTLMNSLFISTEPYIRGISGNPDGVAGFLRDAGIDASSSSKDLSDADMRKLSSMIAAKLLSQGVTKETMDCITSVRYALRDWNVDAGVFSSILDSCGRSGKGGVGIGFGLGDLKCMEAAAALDFESRKRMLSSVAGLDAKGLTKMDNIQYFERGEAGFTGVLCEIAMRYIGDPDRPTVGLNSSEGNTKVSARCNHHLLGKGVDLSAAMSDAGKTVGGGGGGHRIASGAWFPAGKEKEFLNILDKTIGRQLSAR